MSGASQFIVVGSGIAGLRAAISLAPAGRVAILTKTNPQESNTGYAQGGIAAAVGADDTPARHAADTMRAGDGLCDAAAVDVLARDGPPLVDELIRWGVRFDRNDDGTLALALEAAHSVRRVLHAADVTGRAIADVLWHRVCALAGVQTINPALVIDLVVENGAVSGVRYADGAGAVHEVRGRATMLATGGSGQVFRETTNPAIATGDGIALAYRAGARIADVEFVQFHPTALNHAGAPRFLISEAVRGEGARLVNAEGDAFMPRYHADGDLAPRDVVARGIVREMERTGGAVWLSLRHLDAAYVARRFPTIARVCRQAGFDLARDPIPVGPAAHYMMGGVDTDEWGRTSVPGLFAAGEVACTGVHGANRLASNSLLEGLVFGARAAVAMQQPGRAALQRPDRVFVPASEDRPSSSPSDASGAALSRAEIRDLMWRSVGVFRSAPGLASALSALGAAYRARVAAAAAAAIDPDAWRQLNFVTVARLIAAAALRREESRGSHYRADFPERDDRRWRVHTVDRLE